MKGHYKHPFKFYFFSTLIPWTMWFTASCLSHHPYAVHFRFIIAFLGLAGLFGPLLVAAYFISSNKILIKDIAGRIFNVPNGRKRYFLLSLLLMPASIILAMAISLLLGYDLGQFTITGQTTFSSSLFPVWFILISAPILEELAWHSYGTDCLRQKYTLFTTSIIFAAYWALWHMPLAFIQGYYHSNLIVEGALHSINFIVSLFPFVILMNWLYYKTGRNILATVIFHLTANIFNEVFATHPDSKVIQTAILLLLCGYLLVTQREFFFNKKPSSYDTNTAGWQRGIGLEAHQNGWLS